VADEVIAASYAGMLPSGVGQLIMQTTGDSPKAIDRTQVAAEGRGNEALTSRGVCGGAIVSSVADSFSRCYRKVNYSKKNQPGYRSRLLIGYMLTETN
jgi:hypothetical protein